MKHSIQPRFRRADASGASQCPYCQSGSHSLPLTFMSADYAICLIKGATQAVTVSCVVIGQPTFQIPSKRKFPLNRNARCCSGRCAIRLRVNGVPPIPIPRCIERVHIQANQSRNFAEMPSRNVPCFASTDLPGQGGAHTSTRPGRRASVPCVRKKKKNPRPICAKSHRWCGPDGKVPSSTKLGNIDPFFTNERIPRLPLSGSRTQAAL